LKNTDGTEVKLADYKGKVLIVDFWATWCGPCKTEIPTFLALQSQYESKGFSVIGISVDEQSEKAKTFAADNKMNYPILMADEKVKRDYGGISTIPTTFVIDKKGIIRDSHVGVPSDMMVFQRKLEELLAE
jgi:peroxiredoxin